MSLIPNYTDADFLTLKNRLKTLLQKTDTFRDYDFEGANITILMELVSYVGDLNTYFTNKLAQNIHTETANVYEVVHSLVRQQGYVPVGYVASEVELTVHVRRTNLAQSVTYFNEFDQLYIPRWFKVDTGLTDDDGNAIYYCMTEDFTYTCPETFLTETIDNVEYDYVEFNIKMRQGEPLQSPLEYTGEDIIGNQIVMPFQNWDMGSYPYSDNQPSIILTVGADPADTWTRISDFFDDISGLYSEDNVYLLSYDKYKRSVITFSNTRSVPTADDIIKIYPIKTLGISGSVGANTFNSSNTPSTDTIYGDVDVPFLTNITSNIVVGSDSYTVVNDNASVGGSDPEGIEELKIGGQAYSHSQLRNVTKLDYIGNLESRGDITVANAWGEHEQNPGSLNTTYYNRAYISLIPTEWNNDVSNNIKLSPVIVDAEFANNVSGKELFYPTDFGGGNIYNPSWEAELLSYLEPRRMLGIWEQFILPELVYFRLDFGLKVRRTYSWTSVKETIKNKLIYYFNNNNRNFGEVIDFREVYNYILDVSKTSPTDDFSLVRGIQSLVIRDVMIYRDPARIESSIGTQEACENMGGTWTPPCSLDGNIDEMYIYPDNIHNYFPHFVDTGYSANSVDNVYNTIQPIKLGHNQFPQLAKDFCIFVNEG